MLTIQPISKTAFDARKFTNEELEEQRIYQEEYDELSIQKDEFKKLAEDEDFNLPGPVQKAMKGGAIITTGLLGGMAAGWGTKKSIQGLKALNKTKAMQNVYTQLKTTSKFLADTCKTVKTKFYESEMYLRPAKAIKTKIDKLRETKIGGPVIRFFERVSQGIKKLFTSTKNGIKHVWDKIRGVNGETYEKAAINTVGVSGGISSAVMALKEKDNKNAY